MATSNATSDMAQFFDFGEAAMPEVPHEASEQVSAAASTQVYCPAHGNDSTDGCICHGFHEDFAIPDDLQTEPARIEPEWNPDFSSWLPRYQKPAQPCDYCRSRSLECFIYNAGGDKRNGCSPCNALFRPCSFSDPDKMPMQNKKTALDTLDIVGENSEVCFGGLTGKKPMRTLGHVGPIETDDGLDKGPKKGAAAARFPRTAVKILKDWMIEHIDHPYPTDEEKEALKEQTGLTISQISNWMANTRRRQKARPKRSASPSIRPSTEAINIPPGRTWESLNPFERWKHSPPENEPAPMTAIARAVETFDPPELESLSSSYRKDNSNDSTGSFSVFRAPSTTSLETGLTNVSSGSLGSHNSAYSYGSRHSFGSMNSLKSKERRRRRRVPTRAPKADLDDGPRLFQCTFCTDRFKSKYDWSRHEKSLHLSLEKWMCAPLGEVITCSASGRKKCVYCDTLDPSEEHLATHNHSACVEKGREARTFYRKDHLRQHLRLMHGCKMTAGMESWKSEAQYIKSRCGFCRMTFNKWQDRVDHLAKEFRSGATMKDWKGCRGLDAHIAAHVTNAMPPYLIANESKSPFPFSASNSASMKHHNLCLEHNDIEFLIPADKTSPTTDLFINSSSVSPIAVPNNTPQNQSSASISPYTNPNATCWEVLTLRLGRFARQFMEQNGPNSVTDDMLQREARRILYDEPDDPWNQTAADNPEWLNLFKKAHGIDPNAQVTGVTGNHDIFEDLGIRSSTRLDQSFNLNNFGCITMSRDDPAARALAFECSLSGTTNITGRAHQLSSGQYTPSSIPGLINSTSTSTSGASNIPATTYTEFRGLDAPISELACSTPGGICIGENGEMGLAVGNEKCSRKNAFFLPEATSAMASIREQACTKTGDPIFSNIPELACTKAAESFMTPISEQPSATAAEPIQDHFNFPAWDQLPEGFQVPNTTADLSSNIPVSASFDANNFGDMGMGMDMSNAGVVEGVMGNPQVMQWDDNELGFNLDMDMDLDINVDMALGGNMNQQS